MYLITTRPICPFVTPFGKQNGRMPDGNEACTPATKPSMNAIQEKFPLLHCCSIHHVVLPTSSAAVCVQNAQVIANTANIFRSFIFTPNFQPQ